MTIDLALKKASDGLVIESSRLDAQWLLSHVLGCDISYLYAHPTHLLTPAQIATFESLIHRRSQGEPVAYLTSSKGFWDFDLTVTPTVLIPRPETECMVEQAIEMINAHHCMLTIADIATGSGAIAVTLARECPNHTIIATDICPHALDIAKLNAKNLRLDKIHFIRSDLCACFAARSLDVIVCNPPYIAENDPHLTQDGVLFEPQLALVSPENGLHHITQLIHQAQHVLKDQGILFIEHGFDQAAKIQQILHTRHFKNIATDHDLSGQERYTSAINVA